MRPTSGGALFNDWFAWQYASKLGGGSARGHAAGVTGATGGRGLRDQEQLPLGIVLERRTIANPWQDHTWKPVTVFPGAPALDPRAVWPMLAEGDGWAHFHAGTLALELFRKETEGYKVNLSQQPPRLFVGLRSGEDTDCDHDMVPFLVTACPYEAQDYLDSGDELIEAVAMPEGVAAFVQAYIDAHHVDEPFIKRKRTRHQDGDDGFGRRAPDTARRRRTDGHD